MSDGRDYLLSRVATHLEEMAHLAGRSFATAMTPNVVALEGMHALINGIQHRLAKVESLDIDDFGELAARRSANLMLTLDETHAETIAKRLPLDPRRVSQSLANDFWTKSIPYDGKLDSHACDTLIEQMLRHHQRPRPRTPGVDWIRQSTHVIVAGFLDMMLAAFALRTKLTVTGLGSFAYVGTAAVECAADEAITKAVHLRLLRERPAEGITGNLEYTPPAGPDENSSEPRNAPDAVDVESVLESEGLPRRIAKQYADVMVRHLRSLS